MLCPMVYDLLEAAERIRVRAEGWEADWNRLAPALDDAIRARIRIGFPTFTLASIDDITQELLCWYHDRATAGTLLERWDRSRSVVGFLSGSVVQHRVLDWLARGRHPLGLIKLGDAEVTELAVPAQEVRDPDADQHRERTQITLSEMLQPPWKLATPAREVTREYRVAGVELHQRLDWTQPVARRVHTELPAFLQRLPADTWEDELRARLQAKVAVLEKRRTAAEARLDSPIIRDATAARSILAKTLFQLEVCPLEPEDLKAMTGGSAANAQQLVSSYRRALPDLVPALAQAWAVIRRLDAGVEARA